MALIWGRLARFSLSRYSPRLWSSPVTRNCLQPLNRTFSSSRSASKALIDEKLEEIDQKAVAATKLSPNELQELTKAYSDLLNLAEQKSAPFSSMKRIMTSMSLFATPPFTKFKQMFEICNKERHFATIHELYERMRLRKLQVDLECWILLCDAASMSESLPFAQLLHRDILESHQAPKHIPLSLLTALVSMFGKLGDLPSVLMVLKYIRTHELLPRRCMWRW
eukprot:TRINITY_DN20460_c0_g1_i1.p1 TRINITY_DN20460_c0_g1~~TRINITY_DN20460_c0_g1_i1.p1  ORF type:complete len:240 (-),score=10.59 TRINITY_DN20460_c0_g1_i1:135-803(-)